MINKFEDEILDRIAHDFVSDIIVTLASEIDFAIEWDSNEKFMSLIEALKKKITIKLTK